jgi:hypothetical protein
MDAPDRNRGERFAAIPLATAEHAATVEAAVGMLKLAILGPVATATATFTRHEAREIALAMIDIASQICDKEED